MTIEPITSVPFGAISDWRRHHNGGGLVYKTARVDESAYVGPNARVYGEAQVLGNARVLDNALVCGDAQVYGKAQVCGDALVSGDAQVCGDAQVFRSDDLVTVGPIGSRDATMTVCRGGLVFTGCFGGTVDEFLAKVHATHGNNKHGIAYLAAIGFVFDVKGAEWLAPNQKDQSNEHA